MKQITLMFCFLIITKLTFAQQEINNSFTTKMDALFGQLDKNKVPDGILLDYGMEFTNLAEFNGTLTTRNYVTLGRLDEIYKTLLTSKINTNANGLVTPTAFKNNLKTSRKKGIIAVTGFYFKYAKFKDNALSSNLINYTNGKFYDIANKNPYETKQTFAMSPAIQKYSGLNLKVKIPSAIFYSNNNNQIQSIQIDFNNGNGYVTIPFNQNVTVNYTTEGLKTWKYKLNLTNGTSVYSHSKIKIEKGYETYTYGSNNLQKLTSTGVSRYPCKKITATDSYLGQKASVNLTIDLANGHSQITKPLIIAEGFDVGVILSPENEYGYTNYEDDFKRSLQFSGTQLKRLIADYNKQYDIIYVDWDNGVDYLQRNAYALEEVIKWVNSVKKGKEQNVVLGQSMGGVIGRWALADMEERGLNHDTRLFISHDAPQQGANVPVGIQYAYRHIQNQFINTTAGVLVSLFSDVEEPFKLLDTPASKQLLKNRATNSYVLENSLHTSFYNDLKNKGLNNSGGYPINSRNIAISNGSECGSSQGFVAGSDLLKYKNSNKLSFLQNLIAPAFSFLGGVLIGDIDLWGVTVLSVFPGSSKFNTDIWVKSIPYGTGNQIYKGKISYTKKILWLISVTTDITNVNKNQPSGVLPFDSYGGGYYSVTSNINPSLLPSGVFIRDKFSFIPTSSALDIGKNNIALKDVDYKSAYVGGTPPTGTKKSPFKNFISDFDKNPNSQNKPHISFNTRNGNWLAKELSKEVPKANCSIFCANQTISIEGNNALCKANTYTLNIDNGIQRNWSVISGANLVSTLTTTDNSFKVTKLNEDSTGKVVIQAVVGNTDCDQSKTVTRTISLLTKPTISFKDTSLRDAILAGKKPADYPNVSITNGSKITIDQTLANTISWKYTREKKYIPEDAPGTHTYYDPASLVGDFVPYTSCLRLTDSGLPTLASKSVASLVSLIDYYFQEDFYRTLPDSSGDVLPDGSAYNYDLPTIQEVSLNESPKIVFSKSGLLEVEVTAINQCGCATDTNVYKTATSTTPTTPAPQPFVTFTLTPNPVQERFVTISLDRRTKTTNPLAIENINCKIAFTKVATGATVYSKEVIFINNTQNFLVDISPLTNLTTGVYTVTVTSSYGTTSKKLIIE
ncbi:hypothetical protein [Polaribacter cellanae]|uniref:T9SS C-terminal target domain-containing protein n=1 Tax=Polaribacter cellanae TaxID=2818493 RepID=A0A975CKF8_9FLAO|nr:hypothetical protein [Polaribacter cellanae]QTE21378.1 hypothetical protein J3359_11125 [Polaribacter cellanae]